MKIIRDFSKALGFLLVYTRGVRRSRLYVILVIVISIISGLANTALIALVNMAIHRGGAVEPVLLWTFIALCVLLPVSRYISSYLLSYLNSRANLEINTRVSRQILEAPLRKLEDLGSHRIMATLTGDIHAIANILPLLPTVFMNAALVLAALVYLAYLSGVLLIALLVLMIIGVAAYQIPVLKARHYFKLLREEADALFNHFKAMVEGAKELKLHRQRGEAFHTKLLRPTAEAMAHHGFTGSKIHAAAASLGQMLSFVVIGVLVFVGPSISGINTEVLTGYTLTILYVVGALQAIMGLLPAFNHASVAVDKILSLGLPLLTVRPPQPIPPQLKPAQSKWSRLSLKQVTHSYYREKEESTFTLGPIDVDFKPGELVFLIGGNGSGKTTLAKLITGLYTPEQGEVSVDGNIITEQARDVYRQHFSMVFSDFYLFDSLLGLEAPGIDDRAQSYLAQLHLDHKVQVKDGKLSTTSLSQGQRKRLALLTAYLEDRPIYIFDEWASDQDPVFKEVFYFQLLPDLKAKGKTVIVISHDDRYYNLGDRIIKLDYGKVEFDKPVDHARESAARL